MRDQIIAKLNGTILRLHGIQQRLQKAGILDLADAVSEEIDNVVAARDLLEKEG